MPLRALIRALCAAVLLHLLVPMAQAQAASAGAHLTGRIELSVDATDTAHKLLVAHEMLPVSAGDLTLAFPEWLPGTHSRSNDIDRLTGLHMSAAGHELVWIRDPREPFKFDVDIPEGATHLDVDMIYVTPAGAKGRMFIDQNVTEVEWQDVLLYPAGVTASDIELRAKLKLPDGYQFACALEPAEQHGADLEFKPTSLETLIDSPLISGRYFKRVLLSAPNQLPVYLDLVAERPEELDISPEALAQHQALVQQALLLFGTTHYAHYDFLFSISSQIGGIGLEHHQSSEDGTTEVYFSDYKEHWTDRGLLPHEYTHSWNGKYRRPADLATPNYNVPMEGSLLWVYEGQTDYWGNVLRARSGLVSQQQSHEYFAAIASTVDQRAGRSWRSLEDTTRSGAMGGDDSDWRSWQRYAGDYYREMDFVWMQVDAMIRRDSSGQRSLDTFAQLFFGMEPGQRKVTTYRFEDVVAALQQVDPTVDWSAFLRGKLDTHAGQPAADALAMAGWHLAYTESENLVFENRDRNSGSASFLDSIGFDVGKDGKLHDVAWGKAAFKAGATVGLQLLAVNGEAFTKEGMVRALKTARTSKQPIVLLVKDGVLYRTLNVDYHDGPRWPHLVRDANNTDYLDQILAPLARQ
jgi:predicted metalloprotease with PDZ domain